MTADLTPAPDLGAWLDELERLRDAIGDSPAFRVIGFEQDAEEVLAVFDDGGRSVFAECYGADAAALIVAAVNAIGPLTQAVRAAYALADDLAAKCPPDDWGSGGVEDAIQADVGRAFRSALTAALASERTTP